MPTGRHFDVQWTGAKAKPIEIMRTYELLEEALTEFFGGRKGLQGPNSAKFPDCDSGKTPILRREYMGVSK